MKKSRDLRASREKFSRELDDAREERKLEVAFHAAHPQHSPETGKMLATQFVAATLAMTERMLADHRGEKRSSFKPIEHAPYWEIKSFLTEEQKAVIAAAHAKIDQIMLEQKAKSYDELLGALERCGLVPDALIHEDGSTEDIITIENLRVAKTWWDNADAYEDGED